MDKEVDELIKFNDTIIVAVKCLQQCLDIAAVHADLETNKHGLQLISSKHTVTI